MTIKHKVQVALTITAVLLCLLLVSSQYLISGIKKITELFVPASKEITVLNEMSIQISSFENNIDKYFIIKNKTYQDAYKEDLRLMYDFAQLQLEIDADDDEDVLPEVSIVLNEINLLLARFDNVPISEMSANEQNVITAKVYKALEQLKEINSAHVANDLTNFTAVAYEQNVLVERLTLLLTIVILSLFLLVLILALFMLKTVLEPVIKLQQRVEALAGGDFGTKLEVTSKDEVGQLSTAFNAMTEKLAEARGNLEGKVRDRTQKLEEMTSVLQTKIDELEKFQNLTVDRELKMVELKKKISNMQQHDKI